MEIHEYSTNSSRDRVRRKYFGFREYDVILQPDIFSNETTYVYVTLRPPKHRTKNPFLERYQDGQFRFDSLGIRPDEFQGFVSYYIGTYRPNQNLDTLRELELKL